jgi:hypothetical protein
LAIAISDAFVTCYKTKYTHNQERPITFIRANFNPTWSPLIPTPPAIGIFKNINIFQ